VNASSASGSARLTYRRFCWRDQKGASFAYAPGNFLACLVPKVDPRSPFRDDSGASVKARLGLPKVPWILGAVLLALCGLAFSLHRCESPWSPLTLVPSMVGATPTYPTNDNHAAAAIAQSSGVYSIELNVDTFPVGIAGACWNLSRSVDVRRANRLVFWVRTTKPGSFEFKAERLDGQDDHRPIVRRVEEGPWSAVEVPINGLDPNVLSALGKVCVGTNKTLHTGMARIDVKKIEVR
jgi:hypothetical protein